jgi:hypothetical protein
MVATVAKEERTTAPAEPWVLYRDNPTLTWWANQALQAPRLALSVWYFPAVAVWQRWCQAWAEGCACMSPAATGPQAAEQSPAHARAAAESRAELEELRAAWRQYEETKGDDAKSR